MPALTVFSRSHPSENSAVLLAHIAVRLFAAWLALHAPGEILSFYYQGTIHNDADVLVFALSVSMPVIVLILALWFLP